MSDYLSNILVNYAQAVNYSMIDDDVKHEVKRRIIDSMGCLFAGFSDDASNITRNLAYQYPFETSTIIGTNCKTIPQFATIANGTSIRILDYSDTYLSREPLHPSDVIAPLIAMAQKYNSGTKKLIGAIAVAYETAVSLCDSAPLKENGFDHVNYIAIATAAGLVNMLELDKEKAKQALSLSIVPNIALRQTRSGELSMWKGVAGSYAARGSIDAVELAKCGMKGAFKPFEGSVAFSNQCTNGQLLKVVKDEHTFDSIEKLNPPMKILNTHIKYWPVEYMIQSALQAALEIKKEHSFDFDEIENVDIETFKLSYEVVAKDPEKFSPKTKETADHSLPYVVARALKDGKIDLDSFKEDKLNDESLRLFLKSRVKIKENPKLTSGYPEGNPEIVKVTLKNGTILKKHVIYPKGHAKNTLTDNELSDKFSLCAHALFSEKRIKRILNMLWEIENTNLDSLLENLAI